MTTPNGAEMNDHPKLKKIAPETPIELSIGRLGHAIVNLEETIGEEASEAMMADLHVIVDAYLAMVQDCTDRAEQQLELLKFLGEENMGSPFEPTERKRP